MLDLARKVLKIAQWRGAVRQVLKIIGLGAQAASIFEKER